MISGIIKAKLTLAFTLLIFTCKISTAQSNEVLAKSTYLEAEESFTNKDFEKTIENLNKTIEYLGASNAKIEALYVKTKIRQNDYIEAEKHLSLYFELADESRKDYMEMVKLAADVKEKAEEVNKRIEAEKAKIKLESQKFLSPDYFVYVSGGTFDMGKGRSNYYKNPVKYNTKVNSFYIAKTEVTVGLYLAYCEATNTKPHEPYDKPLNGYKIDEPVSVSWYQAIAFCEWASKKLNKKISLPTGAQWEFAARGGNKSRGYKYAGSNNFNEVGWWKGNSNDRVHSVAKLKPNELELYDMSGNLNEWTLSKYHLLTADGNAMMAVYGGGYGELGPTNIPDTYPRSKEAKYYKVGFRVVSY